MDLVPTKFLHPVSVRDVPAVYHGRQRIRQFVGQDLVEQVSDVQICSVYICTSFIIRTICMADQYVVKSNLRRKRPESV